MGLTQELYDYAMNQGPADDFLSRLCLVIPLEVTLEFQRLSMELVKERGALTTALSEDCMIEAIGRHFIRKSRSFGEWWQTRQPSVSPMMSVNALEACKSLCHSAWEGP